MTSTATKYSVRFLWRQTGTQGYAGTVHNKHNLPKMSMPQTVRVPEERHRVLTKDKKRLELQSLNIFFCSKKN